MYSNLLEIGALLNPQYFFMVIAVISALGNLGAVAFVFRYGIRLAVLEQLESTRATQVSSLLSNYTDVHAKMAVMDTVVSGMKDVLPDLRRISGMVDKIDSLCESVKQFVPRLEIDARFGAVNEQVQDISQRVTSNFNRIHTNAKKS